MACRHVWLWIAADRRVWLGQAASRARGGLEPPERPRRGRKRLVAHRGSISYSGILWGVQRTPRDTRGGNPVRQHGSREIPEGGHRTTGEGPPHAPEIAGRGRYWRGAPEYRRGATGIPEGPSFSGSSRAESACCADTAGGRIAGGASSSSRLQTRRRPRRSAAASRTWREGARQSALPVQIENKNIYIWRIHPAQHLLLQQLKVVGVK